MTAGPIAPDLDFRSLSGSESRCENELPIIGAQRIGPEGLYFRIEDNKRLVALDYSDPVNPKLVGTYSVPGEAIEFTTTGNFAYLAENTPSGKGMLHIIDIRNPSAMSKLGQFESARTYAERIKIDQTFAYVFYRSALEAIDVSDPATPFLVFEIGVSIGNPKDVIIEGDQILIASDSPAHFWSGIGTPPEIFGGGLHVFNISNPSTPYKVGEYPRPSFAVRKNSGNLCLSTETGVESVEIVPANPQRISNYPVGAGVARPRMSISARKAFISTSSGIGPPLEIVDLTDDQNPKSIGIYDFLEIFDLVALTNYIYTVSDAGLNVLDVTNPGTPLGSYFPNYPGASIALSGDVLAVAYLQDLTIFDISNPMLPSLMGGLKLPGTITDVSLTRESVYVTAHNVYSETNTNGTGGGFHVINISDPSAPWIQSSITGRNYEEIVVAGNYAYVCDSRDLEVSVGEGLVIIDIGNLAMPRKVGQYRGLSTPAVFGPTISPMSIAVEDHYAYLVSPALGLEVIDISDPTRPRRVGGNSMVKSGDKMAIAVANDRVYIAGGALTILHKYRPLELQYGSFPPLERILRVAGPPKLTARIQRSNDLSKWTDWLEVSLSENPVAITDPDSISSSRFYRAITP